MEGHGFPPQRHSVSDYVVVPRSGYDKYKDVATVKNSAKLNLNKPVKTIVGIVNGKSSVKQQNNAGQGENYN